ncbi:putative Na+/H+ antiporter [Nitrosomonas sp.]|uniref:putative Na+/H+ antiporter n=1 Tax=Nitrosomonas sp. TaxID=42353 RepID=UPI0025E273CE|nr:putative Na+/H+ antiporter [Nitrosomonas sp.]
MTLTLIELMSSVLFALAILHTFSTGFFKRLAHIQPAHAGIWHLLGEVEVVFGFWALVLVVVLFIANGEQAAINYIDSRNFTEPMFVFAIMVVAGTRPILQVAKTAVYQVARIIPLQGSMGFNFTVLSLVPLIGSLITEPAAMTLAALILAERIFIKGISSQMKYAILAVLFVNISIGGTLTHFAAPPVLMVAGKWNWDMTFMLMTFGWKSVIAIVVNALCVTLLFREELRLLPETESSSSDAVPFALICIHLVFLAGIVIFSHHPAMFMGLFLFFLGIAHAYQRYQDRLILREGLLVAFFLAGLVVLGGQQQWWLQPLLLSMSGDQMFLGATLLTAVTDNAALTYLGSLVDGLSDSLKYALVSGAVTGGGLTVIANAPNPAGVAILRTHFDNEAVHPFRLLLAALLPTFAAALAFRLL